MSKIYNSTLDLSARISDISNVYILPPLCLLGIIFNTITLFVLIKSNLKKEIFRFILITTVCDLCFLVINSFTFLIRCGSLCATGYTFSSKFYELYVHLYIGNTFLLFGTLLNIIVSLSRFFSLSAKSTKSKFEKLRFEIKCFGLILVSLIVNAPSYLISRSVQLLGYLEFRTQIDANTTQLNYEALYSATTNDIGKNAVLTSFLFVLTVFRGLFLLILLFVINVLIGYKFAKYLENKKKIMPFPLSVNSTNSKYFFVFLVINRVLNDLKLTES